MRLIRWALFLSALPSVSAAQNEQNRIDLNNGGDVLTYFQDPFLEGDPANDDYDGDSYYKVFPGTALQRGSDGDNTAKLVAHEFPLYDLDWSNDTTIGVMLFDNAVANGLGELMPDPYDGIYVELPELEGTGFTPPSGCPSPGFVFGFDVRETFLDTAGTPAPIDLDVGLPTDHWAFTAYFTGVNSTTSGSVALPNPNSCGNSGDAVFPWFQSTDEMQSDWLGTGTSAYGGFQVGTGGSSGVNAFVPGTTEDGSDTAWFFNRPTVELNVIVNLTGTPSAVAPGLAGLQPHIGLNSGGVPTGGPPSIGFLHHDGRAHSVSGTGLVLPLAMGFANVGPTFLDLTGSCILVGSACISLLPSDPVFLAATTAWGFPFFADETFPGFPDLDEATATSALVPLVAGAGTVGVELKVQTITVDVGSGNDISGDSQLFRFTLQASP